MRVINILAEDAGTIHLEIKSEAAAYEVMADVRREGSTLILDRAHIAAVSGVGSIGAAIRTELQEAARQFGKQQGASGVIIVPGARLGGAGPVSPIRVEVE
jgi:hypothetical protein